MILQALNEYYQRLAEDEDSGIPLRGFSRQPVPFALEINKDGTLMQVADLRVQSGKKLVARQLVVPEAVKRSGTKPPPNFMWDNTGYVLGADEKGKPERSAWAFKQFREGIHAMTDGVEDEGLAAVLTFLDAWSPKRATELECWQELSGQNVVFRLSGETRFVHERPKVREAWLRHYFAKTSETKGQCLVTGQEGVPIARLHADIKGVRGAQTKGATLVGFNLRAFESYGKDHLQGLNAPVSEEAAFNYTTALNDLLRRDSRQKVQIGDATVVFWTERKTASEVYLGLVFSQAESEGDLADVRLFLEAARDGKMPDKLTPEAGVRFYVLGLSPNASRLSVRFWHVDTVEGIWRRLGQHFADLRIVHKDKEPEYLSVHQLLRGTLTLKDPKDYWESIGKKPHLPGDFMRAILSGASYPRTLLSMLLGRIRTEQANKDSEGRPINNVTYARAALVKACLVRNARLRGQTPEVVSVSLDEQSTNVPYRLGRLFAVLEKVQEEAHQPNKLNSTIMDKYYGSASATPRAVFPILQKLKVHHLRKFTPQMRGLAIARERLIAAILDGVNVAEGGFPAHLSLEDQGLFTLGYYHQRTDLWTSKKTAPETATAEPGENKE